MRMAAIYARVSSEQQREANTIASQTTSLIAYAREHDLEVPAEWVFEDDGYSGATLERPGLERVRDLAAEGQIQVVLAYAPDRLSRKYAYQILLIEELARNGVETLFIKAPQGSSAEDQLLVQFQGMIAEYERAQILERSRRGKRHRAHSGEVSVMSGAPYGYRYVRKTDEAPAAYAVLEAEARVVERIYQMYTVEGLSIGEVTAGSTPNASRLAKQVPAGNARLSGPCCATLRIVVSPVSVRPAPLHGRASSVRCVGGVWLRPAPRLATSARAKNGSRSPCRHW
jgi:site-specific DNA recombinase